jgi:hypothetical protein
MKKQLLSSKFSVLVAMGMALYIIPVLFFSCANPMDIPRANAPAAAGYGNVTVSFAGSAARTVFPAQVFANYSYSFTKSGGSLQVMTPDEGGKFTLEAGDWTVEVKAYAGAVTGENLAATGMAQFTVNDNDETSVTVYLTGITESGSGTFTYRIQYPMTVALTTITMEKLKLSDSDEDFTVDLNTLPSLGSGVMVSTKTTAAIPAGFYMVSLRLAMGDRVAGRNEVVHIYNNLTSEFGTVESPIVFNEDDFAQPGAPDAPVISTVVAAFEQLTVTWTAVPKATAYEVWYGTTNDTEDENTVRFGDDITSGTSGIITGLTNSTRYYVWVKAKNTIGTSEFSPSSYQSPSSSTSAPSTNTRPTVTAGNQQLIVTWAAVTRAVAYEVWYGTSDNSGEASKFGDDVTDGVSAVIIGLTNDTTYYVWTKAKNSNGMMNAFSPVASGIPTAGPAVPAAPTVTQIGDQLQLAVSWTPTAGATSYQAVYNTANNITDAKEIDTISGTTGTITGARESTETLDNRVYYVFVKAINAQGESVYSTAGIGIFPPPAAPVVTAYAVNQLYVSWTAVAGANGYDVYYNTADTTEGAESISSTAAGIALPADLIAGETYYVWVKAKFNTPLTISGFSPAGRGTVPVKPADPAAAPVVTPGIRQLDLSWSAVSGATSYEVWYGTSNDSGTAVKFGDTPLTTAAITKLADATSYHVWIKAKNIVGTSAFSPVASGTTRPPSDISVDRGVVTVKDSDGGVVTGFALFKSGNTATPQTITLSVDGIFTNAQWYVDGNAAGGNATLSLDADTYAAAVHSVSFAGWRDGVYVSSTPIPFTVYDF